MAESSFLTKNKQVWFENRSANSSPHFTLIMQRLLTHILNLDFFLAEEGFLCVVSFKLYIAFQQIFVSPNFVLCQLGPILTAAGSGGEGDLAPQSRGVQTCRNNSFSMLNP